MKPDLFSLEAEMSALGGAFLSRLAAQDIAGTLEVSDFHSPSHQVMFSAVRDLVKNRQPVDFVTMINALGPARLKEVGGEDYILQIAEYVPSPANSASYAAIVKNMARRRYLAEAGPKVYDLAHDMERETSEVVDAAQGLVMGVTSAPAMRRGAEDMAKDAMNRADKIISGEVEWAVRTGLVDVDERLGGTAGGMVGLIAARTSMGKTSWLVSVALNCARNGQPVLIFELEQPERQLMDRFAQMLSGVNSRDLRKFPTPENYAKYAEAMETFSGLPITIIDDSSTSTQEVRGAAREMIADGVKPIVFIDYLGLLRNIEKVQDHNRNQTMAERAKAIKRIAKDLDIPIILFSQINRGKEGDSDKRPAMSNIRDSGEIEEAADWIGMLYRHDYYHPPEPRRRIEVCEFIVTKNREGEVGTELLCFEPGRTQFSNLAADSKAIYWQQMRDK